MGNFHIWLDIKIYCIVESWEFIKIIQHKSMLLCERIISIILIILIWLDAIHITLSLIHLSSIYDFQIITQFVQKNLVNCLLNLLRNSNFVWTQIREHFIFLWLWMCRFDWLGYVTIQETRQRNLVNYFSRG